MAKISIIIPTYNEEANISNILDSVKAQSVPKEDIEVVVVDNSSDKTQEIAESYGVKVFRTGPERSAQRNYGVAHSSSDIIGYLDCDMILSENVLAEVIEKFEKDNTLTGIYINEQVIDAAKNLKATKFWTKVRNFERQFYDKTAVDVVRFVKKQDFEKVNGFDEQLTGPEDWDFQKKLKKQCGNNFKILTSVIYHNEKNLNPTKVSAKKEYYAKSFDKYVSKWGKQDTDIQKQFGFWYRYFIVFMENGKWKRIFAQPILFMSMFISRFFVGVSFLKSKIEK